MLNCGLRQHSFQSLPWMARRSTRGMARQGVAPEQCCSPAGTRDRHRGWTGDHKRARKTGWKREKGKNWEGDGNKGLWTPSWHSHHPSCWAQTRLMPAVKRLPLLRAMGTLTPLGPLPALFFSVFLWEPFTSSKREVCVYFSSLPFDSNSPLFFCQRVRNKFRFKRQPEMCMHAQSSFIFIMP